MWFVVIVARTLLPDLFLVMLTTFDSSTTKQQATRCLELFEMRIQRETVVGCVSITALVWPPPPCCHSAKTPERPTAAAYTEWHTGTPIRLHQIQSLGYATPPLLHCDVCAFVEQLKLSRCPAVSTQVWVTVQLTNIATLIIHTRFSIIRFAVSSKNSEWRTNEMTYINPSEFVLAAIEFAVHYLQIHFHFYFICILPGKLNAIEFFTIERNQRYPA